MSGLSLYAPLASEAQVFSLQEPGYFFSMYSPPRTEAAYKPARTRLEEDLRFASRMVRSIESHYWSNFTLSFAFQDNKRLHLSQRISLYPILHAFKPSSIGTVEASSSKSSPNSTRGHQPMAHKSRPRFRSQDY